MDNRSRDRMEEFPTVETPEDVAVLYSWANLHGAKYRDFSASRREYRAQLRHRAAEQAREQELRAQAEAEAAAAAAERTVRSAQSLAVSQAEQAEAQRQRTLDRADEAARVAAAERGEAARRAEAAAQADASAERERREIAAANASARRQAAQYAESDSRRRYASELHDDAELPGRISDPYTPASGSNGAPPHALVTRGTASGQPSPAHLAGEDLVDLRPTRYRTVAEQPTEREVEPRMDYDEDRRREAAPEPGNQRPDRTVLLSSAYQEPAPKAVSTYQEPPPDPAAHRGVPPGPAPRRPQGYRPDDASGVVEIYRGPGQPAPSASRKLIPAADRGMERNPFSGPTGAPGHSEPSSLPARSPEPSHRRTMWAGSAPELRTSAERPKDPTPEQAPTRPASGYAQTPVQPREAAFATDDTPRRRRQDQEPAYRTDSGSGPSATPPLTRERESGATRLVTPSSASTALPWTSASSDSGTERSRERQPAEAPAPAPGPAWIYSPQTEGGAGASSPAISSSQHSVADTLQHSRERVAARWYALKGVFDQPGQEQSEPQPVRQKEIRTPILAVFSLAGGVGKTSLVATLGRALSSMGEKVLLTDTTSHGLLPFYFGASELRQGTVRTFSPPSGSTDAPISLVSYDVDGASDEHARETLVEEISANTRGTHRALLDLSVVSAWLLRRMSHLSPTVLVPVAPDMNSVISLGAVERYFTGLTDADGAPTKVSYVLNQFDASLPLHLDVREVLRRQLGERLLPFAIRRAPAISEALAEGMTIIDYSPEVPVAEDYLNVATWLRSQAAPATAGFRNVRWSER